MLADNPIIILGAPRSGTTYLKEILNRHPDIHITHEIRLFVWAHRSLTVVPTHPRALLSHKEDFLRHLHEALPAIIRGFYERLPELKGKTIWGDKNPHYAAPSDPDCLETIRRLFPGTRFLHIIRDGRDVVASLIRKTDTEGRAWVDWPGAHDVWLSHVSNAHRFAKRNPNLVYEVRYEDLVDDDLVVARRLFGWLKLEITKSVETFCLSQRENRTPFSEPIRNLGKGVRQSDWSSGLTPSEQLKSLTLLGRTLVEHGYETESTLESLDARIREEQSKNATPKSIGKEASF